MVSVCICIALLITIWTTDGLSLVEHRRMETSSQSPLPNELVITLKPKIVRNIILDKPQDIHRRIKEFEQNNEELYKKYMSSRSNNKSLAGQQSFNSGIATRVAVLPSIVIGDSEERTHSKRQSEPGMLRGQVDMDGAKLWINGQLVWSRKTARQTGGAPVSLLQGGVSALVLHQQEPRKVFLAQYFHTSTAGADTMLLDMLATVTYGRIVVLLGAPNFVSWLRDSQAEKLRAMLGCQCDFELTTGESWILVTTKRTKSIGQQKQREEHSPPEEHNKGRLLYEGYATSRSYGSGLQLAPPHHFAITIAQTGPPVHCPGSVQPVVRQRAHFCSNYEGYAEFCDCHDPLITNTIYRDTSTPRGVIPVVLVGGGQRLPQVLRQVVTIRVNRHGSHTPMLLSVDKWSEEAYQFAALLNLPVIFNRGNTGVNGTQRINAHIAFSLNASLYVHPRADMVIVLEDDLRLSPDFMRYFHKTAILMDYDKSVYFVNAYRYNAYPHSATNSSAILRARGYPYYGWMVRREDGLTLLDKWVPQHLVADWDMYIKTVLMGRRSVILPEVPRTKHEGGQGVHVGGVSQEEDYNRRPLNSDAMASVCLGRTWELAYNLDLMLAIDRSTRVKITHHPCITSPVPRHSNESFVIHITADGDVDDDKSFFVLATCMDLFEHGIQEHYEYTFRLRHYDTYYYIVGCPVSPFCVAGEEFWYKPSKSDVSLANKIKWKRRNDQRESGRVNFRVQPANIEEEFNKENVVGQNIGYLHQKDYD